MTASPNMISALEELSGRYSAILCDVWGVLHNGEKPFPAAASALAMAREGGVPVVLITNAPRPHAGVDGAAATHRRARQMPGIAS